MRQPVLVEIVSIAMAFEYQHRVRDYQPDVSNYGFAFIRWMLNTIAILIVGAAIVIGLVIVSTIMHWGY